ncbi:hypothetical protein METBIDRAFT_32136 [Metschnikowia bicuspidata var. bicuspidata NRRL YB-4993]|uniref:Uncharacterized protein n=1 Tax=Metschnikowia bicuspidata var. bicuspidata NRRL YB-4993 TaxID=869754 RepID=A0A1A0HCK8_9ASCO|nr:hypothetical protein METBIDRAFT_32136 [Metschnikowia bicuspidata var. bicuspidata NRRL YB-4993]OBA21658.1 hypothetical protein METBIDRAFT_32136 [Metschnikowia bicuspidata var. bicuspidata NRRL YB-4993]
MQQQTPQKRFEFRALAPPAPPPSARPSDAQHNNISPPPTPLEICPDGIVLHIDPAPAMHGMECEPRPLARHTLWASLRDEARRRAVSA